MSIVLKFVKPWEYWEDAAGDVRRQIPVGLVVELNDDVAAAAIFDGAVEVPKEIPPDVQRYIAMFQDVANGATIEEAEARLQAAIDGAGGEAGAGDGDTDPSAGDDGGEETRTIVPIDPATGEPAKKVKRKATT